MRHVRHKDKPATESSGEQGFVLMTALWLLLLCGTFVALITLKNQQQSASVKSAAASAQARFDADAAIETVMADVLIKGAASSWARLPASGSVQVGDDAVQVAITAESGRLDLNTADVGLISRALLGQASASQRAAFLAALQKERASGSRVDGVSDAAPLLALLKGKVCLDDWFTTFSGQSQADVGLAPPTMVSALGAVIEERGDSAVRPGQALRLDVKARSGPPVQLLVRMVGRQDRAFDMLSWIVPAACNPQ